MVDPQVRVAVGDEERVAEEVERVPDRTGRPGGPRPVERVPHVEAEASTVSHGVYDLLAEMTDAQHDAPGAVSGEQAQLVEDERLARHRSEGLRRAPGPLPQARPEPARQDRDGVEGHAYPRPLDGPSCRGTSNDAASSNPMVDSTMYAGRSFTSS